MEDHPCRFFDYLNVTDAFELYFNELCDWNGEALKFAVDLNATFEERVGLLLLDTDYKDAERILARIKAPTHLVNTVLWTCNLATMIDEITPPFFVVEGINKKICKTLDQTHAWRSIEAIRRAARIHLYDASEETCKALRCIITAVLVGKNVGFDDLDPQTRDKLVGREIGEAISQKRREVIQELNLFPS